MYYTKPSQRAIKLGEFRSESDLQSCQETFQEKLEALIRDNGLSDVGCKITRSPNLVNQPDDESPVLVQLYAQVTWPKQQKSRIGVMALEDLLDTFNINQQPQQFKS
jgi:hypothetical protein